jgi:O-antigen/teichoic acid export membrane protein
VQSHTEPASGGSQASSTIKNLVFAGSLWTMAGSFAGQFCSFVIFVILARLLSPYEFGLVAFLALFIDLTRGVIVGGIPEALIQRKIWSVAAAHTAFWLNMAATFTFVALAFAGALLIQHSSGSSLTAWLFVALSLTLTIDGARAVHEAYLRRHFSYKLLAVRTVLASIVGGIVGIAAALAGFGVWALVVQRLVTSLVQTATVWRLADYTPRLYVRRDEIRPLLSFSSKVMVGRLMAQMNARLPDFVIGSVAGPAALGLFRVASRSLNFLVQLFVTPLQTTMLSAFARLKDREAVTRAYIRFTQVCAIVLFPAFLGSAAIAPDFIRLCFGEKWSGGAWIMVVLSLAVFPRALVHFFQPAMQAIGKPQLAIGPEATRLVIGAVIVTAASLAGPLAAAVGDTARRYVSIPQSLRILHDELGLPPSRLIRAIAVPMLCSLAMCGTVVLLQPIWLADWSAAGRLAICVAAGAMVYVGLLLAFARTFLAGVLDSARHGLPKRLRRLTERALDLLPVKPSDPARPA